MRPKLPCLVFLRCVKRDFSLPFFSWCVTNHAYIILLAEESAKSHGEGFIAAADELVKAIDALFVGVSMPKSDFSLNSLFK